MNPLATPRFPALRPHHSGRARRGPRREQGFLLLSVLTAALIFGLGLLGIAYAYAAFTSAATQNQNLMQMAPASNGFWGVVQANPAILPTMAGTYTGTTGISTAPAALQPWLTNVTSGLPGASIVIATGPDAAGKNSGCDSSSGCSVTLTLNWTQNGNPNANSGAGISRQQTFYFQFGL